MDEIMLVVIALAFVGVIYGIIKAVQAIKRHSEFRKEQERIANEAMIESTRKWREEMRRKMATPPPAKESPSDLAYMADHNLIKRIERRADKPSKVSLPSYVASPTQSVQSSSTNDGFLDGMVTGYVINSLVDSLTHKSEDSSSRSVGVKSSESSWGFDDSDSRKSVSSSMDTSSSYSSSSSDSYSSSSDSGPSSDW